MDNTVFFILFIVADVIVLGLLILWLIKYQNKKIRSKTLKEFNSYVAENNLVMDKMQTLNKNIIGLDRENMKIVFLDRSRKTNQLLAINLEEIRSCKTVKSRKTTGGHIHRIDLQINFKDASKDAILLPFYDENRDKFYKMMRLAKKAYYWQKSITLFKEIPAVS